MKTTARDDTGRVLTVDILPPETARRRGVPRRAVRSPSHKKEHMIIAPGVSRDGVSILTLTERQVRRGSKLGPALVAACVEVLLRRLGDR